jgi:superfamily II DNA or RNA helicase
LLDFDANLPAVKVEHNAHSRRLDEVQKDVVRRAHELLRRERRCLVQMTTGTGKTIVGAKIINTFPRAKILWLTQTEELIQQTVKDLSQWFSDVGIFQRQEQSFSSRVVVASLQSITKDENLKRFRRKHFGLLVVDEAHHAAADSWAKVVDYFDCKKLGLTATPHRHDGRDISEIFGKRAAQLSYEQAKEMKLIASEVYRVILTNSKVEGLVTRSGDYKPSELDRLVVSENRNQIIVDSYKKYGRKFMDESGLQRKAICFCITVSHAVRMRDFFNKNGVSAEILVGKTGKKSASYAVENRPQTELERAQAYKSFCEGDGAEVLCVVNVLNEGKNIRDVGCLLMARPTRSGIIFAQQMGRGCRRIEGKKHEFMVLDFVDLINERFPPMTLSRLTGVDYDHSQIDVSYYRGADPIVVNEYVEYLSQNYEYRPEEKWTREKIKKALLDFYKIHGEIRIRDLVTSRTGLPSRAAIRRHYKSVSDCFRLLKIPSRPERLKWDRKSSSEAILAFWKGHRKILITDLHSGNGLPSKRTVDSLWGSWPECLSDLRIDGGWTAERIILALSEFYLKRGRYPRKTEMLKSHGLPSMVTVKKHFKNLTGAIAALVEKAA